MSKGLDFQGSPRDATPHRAGISRGFDPRASPLGPTPNGADQSCDLGRGGRRLWPCDAATGVVDASADLGGDCSTVAGVVAIGGMLTAPRSDGHRDPVSRQEASPRDATPHGAGMSKGLDFQGSPRDATPHRAGISRGFDPRASPLGPTPNGADQSCDLGRGGRRLWPCDAATGVVDASADLGGDCSTVAGVVAIGGRSTPPHQHGSITGQSLGGSSVGALSDADVHASPGNSVVTATPNPTSMSSGEHKTSTKRVHFRLGTGQSSKEAAAGEATERPWHCGQLRATPCGAPLPALEEEIVPSAGAAPSPAKPGLSARAMPAFIRIRRAVLGDGPPPSAVLLV